MKIRLKAGYKPDSHFYGVSHEMLDRILQKKLQLDASEKAVIVNRERTVAF